jgi:hypothetical protein
MKGWHTLPGSPDRNQLVFVPHCPEQKNQRGNEPVKLSALSPEDHQIGQLSVSGQIHMTTDVL